MATPILNGQTPAPQHPTAQPAATPTAGTSNSAPAGEPELRVEVLRDHDWAYRGTRAQLEAEGVIPAGEWPQETETRVWTTGGVQFSLRRIRPDGFKGPKRLWAAADCWVLQGRKPQGADNWQVRIRELQRQIAKLEFARSPEGQREFQVYWRATEDNHFQAFKKRLLLPRNKPRRKAKSEGNEGGQR